MIIPNIREYIDKYQSVGLLILGPAEQISSVSRPPEIITVNYYYRLSRTINDCSERMALLNMAIQNNLPETVIVSEFSNLSRFCDALKQYIRLDGKYPEVSNEISPIFEYVKEARRHKPTAREYTEQIESIAERISNIRNAIEQKLFDLGIG